MDILQVIRMDGDKNTIKSYNVRFHKVPLMHETYLLESMYMH